MIHRSLVSAARHDFFVSIIRIPQAKVNNSNVADIWFPSAIAPASASTIRA